MQANSGMVRYRVFVEEEGVQLRSRRCGSQEKTMEGAEGWRDPSERRPALVSSEALYLYFCRQWRRASGERNGRWSSQ